MAHAVLGEMPLVQAPAELRGLQPLADESVHRPSVHELAALLALGRDLRVALGDVDHLHAEPLRKPPPVWPRVGFSTSSPLSAACS
jgi:hypothetical protein